MASWTKFLLHLFFISASVEKSILSDISCLFDDIRDDVVPRVKIKYAASPGVHSHTHVHGVRVRRNDESPYKPIRVELHFSNLDDELTISEQERLEDVVKEMIDKVSDLFSVIPVQENLILKRSDDACYLEWHSGMNKNKCAQAENTYAGETCSKDKFYLPNEHLEGVYTWNHTYPQPDKTIIPPGPGVANTDFILYVRSATTHTCLSGGESVLAYATYCQLDQNDRPIAGYLNFCPPHVRGGAYDEDKIKKIALHELFHALGFSADLFSRYRKCLVQDDGSTSCERHARAVSLVEGAQRLVTPNVVEVTSAHFGCETHPVINEFGAILQTGENGEVRSHWDEAFMYGSLMTPTIRIAHQSVIDPITLALFEDTGWYQVNYFYADLFLWGKGTGCNFGVNPACEQPAEESANYFCTGNKQGCHYLNYDRGTCDTDDFLHNCRVFKSIPQDNCQDPANNPAAHVINVMGSLCGSESRCFTSNLTLTSVSAPGEWSGHCYLHKCNSSGHVWVKVGKEDWTYCPFNTHITISKYSGYLLCPPEGVLCMEVFQPTTEPPQLPTTTKRYSVHTDKSDVLCIDVIFAMGDYGDLESSGLVTLFQDCVEENIHLKTGVSRRRINSVKLYRGSIVFEFDLHPALYSDDGPVTEVVANLLEKIVASGNFTFKLPPSGPFYTAQRIVKKVGGPVLSEKQLPHGVIAAAVVGAVAAATLIGVLVFFVQRHYTAHSRVTNSARPSSRSQTPRASSYPSIPGLPPDHITNSFYSNSARAHQSRDRQSRAHQSRVAPPGARREVYDSSTRLTEWGSAGGLDESRGSSHRLSDHGDPRGSSAGLGDIRETGQRLSDISHDSAGLSDFRGGADRISDNRRNLNGFHGNAKPERSRSVTSTRDIEMRETGRRQ